MEGGPAELQLSADDVARLQKAWRLGQQHQQAGLAAFRFIFMTLDEIRRVFGFEDFDDANFLRHTKVFSAYLDKMMDALGDRASFDHLCDNLGRRHVYVRSEGAYVFRPEYWDTFCTAIIGCALEDEHIAVQSAWRSVCLYMIQRMKHAYHAEMRASHRKMSVNLASSFPAKLPDPQMSFAPVPE